MNKEKIQTLKEKYRKKLNNELVSNWEITDIYEEIIEDLEELLK